METETDNYCDTSIIYTVVNQDMFNEAVCEVPSENTNGLNNADEKRIEILMNFSGINTAYFKRKDHAVILTYKVQ